MKHVLLQLLTFSLLLCRHNLHLKSSCCCWVKALQVDLLMEEVEAGAAASASPCPLLLGRHLQPLLQADKSQQRCADAGSSILKQVLPMFPHLPGTPSPADTGYGSVKHGRTTRSSPPQLFIILPIANLPAIVHDLVTMTDVFCIDIAVAQATQTLQQLQQQQAALYSGMGAKYMPHYYPYHPDQVGHHQSRAMFSASINRILLCGL